MHSNKIDGNLNQQNAINSILSLKLILERCDRTCDLVADQQYDLTLDALISNLSVLGPKQWEEKLSPQLHKIYPLMSAIRKSATQCSLVNRALPDRGYKLFTQHCLLQINECKTLVGQLIAQLEGDAVLSLELIKSIGCTMRFTLRALDTMIDEEITNSLRKEDRDLLELAKLIDF